MPMQDKPKRIVFVGTTTAEVRKINPYHHLPNQPLELVEPGNVSYIFRRAEDSEDLVEKGVITFYRDDKGGKVDTIFYIEKGSILDPGRYLDEDRPWESYWS